MELWFWSERRIDPASQNRKHQLSAAFPFDPTINWIFVTYGAYFLFSLILHSDITESRRSRSQHFCSDPKSRGRFREAAMMFPGRAFITRTHTGRQRATRAGPHRVIWGEPPPDLSVSFSHNQTSAPVFSAPSGLSSIRLISQSNEQTPDKSCSVLCDWASVFWVNASLLTGLSSGYRMLITALWALLGSLHLVEMFASVRAS